MAIITFEDYTYEITPEEEFLMDEIEKILKALKPGELKTNYQIRSEVYMTTQGAIDEASEARVRKIIHILRVTDRVPLLIASQKGYLISYDPARITKYIQSLEERIDRIERVRNAIERQQIHMIAEDQAKKIQSAIINGLNK